MARFVGYLEEQAVVTYSDILDKMDEGKLPMWSNLPAPEIAAKYLVWARDSSFCKALQTVHTLGFIGRKIFIAGLTVVGGQVILLFKN